MNKISLKYGFRLFGIYYVFISLFLNEKAFSQKEANNWYFGTGAGITFNTNPPTGVTNGKLSTIEGCATMSNKQGRLLFYTDGTNVWDSTHTLTANGKSLAGNPSSTQSGIIVPKPGNAQHYYIFTVAAQSQYTGIQYSLFDMSLNSGKGDIVSTQKNVRLLDTAFEKITAVQHSNGTDFWVLTQKYNSDSLFAFLVTSAGVNKIAVKSTTGLKIKNQSHTPGYMKLSPDGTKIAYANVYLGYGIIADFNSATGKVSNVWSFKMDIAYGLEFSASGKYLYIGQYMDYLIFQFDAKAKTIGDFLASKVQIDNRGGSTNVGALQLGPDKKIYISRVNKTYLDVIHAPDSAGKACRVQYDYIYLKGKSCYLGLPTFIQSYFKPDYVTKGSCFGDTTWFSISDTNSVDSVKWTFGDPASQSKNNSKGFKVYHLFSNIGSYKVRSVAFNAKVRDTAYIDVKQIVPSFTLGKDTFVCEKGSVNLGYFKELYDKYEWGNKSTNPDLLVNSPGLYTLKIVDKYGCRKSDTINVSQRLLPKVDLGNDTAICNKTTLIILNAENQSPGIKYKWGTSEATQFYNATTPGKYWVTVTNSCGSISDTFKIKFSVKPTVNLPKDTILCENESLILNPAAGNDAKYLWLSGDTVSTLTVAKAGKYLVTASNACGSDKDSINIDFYQIPHPEIGPDQIFCDHMTPTLRTVNLKNVDSIRWSDNRTGVTNTFNNPGKYWVTVSNRCGEASDTVSFEISQSPGVYLGKDTTLCGHFNLLLDAGNRGMLYQWEPTKETSQTIIATQQTIYTVKVINKNACTGTGSLKINNNCVSKYWFPNSFTPNSDILNDIFKPVLVNYENYEMRIFNRWGEMLFETKDVEKGWDGTYEGKICQDGVYFFVSDFISTEDNNKQFIKGTITLLK